MSGILGDFKFKNEIMDSLLNFEYFLEEKAGADVVQLIVQNTNSDSKLHLWLAYHLRGMREYEFRSIKFLLDAEMLRLILGHYISADQRMSTPSLESWSLESLDRCNFHDHAPETWSAILSMLDDLM